MADIPSDNTKPTICHVVHVMHVGGAEILAREFAEQFKRDYRVVFACLDSCGSLGEELKAQGVVVEVIGRKPGFDYGCARRLANFLRQQRVDIVHAHQYAPFFYTAIGRIAHHRTPILFMEHGRDYPDYPRPKRKLANRFLLSRKDRVVAVGECVRQALIDNEGLAAEKIEVVYNGMELERYDADRSQRATLRRQFGFSDDETVILQVARLNRLKDHPTAVRAMAELRKECPQARLVLVGDGEERHKIEQLVQELDMHEHVRLLGVRDDVPALLQMADLFCLSSISEGIPLTLIEAMATGLACVATDVGGNGEVIQHDVTGKLARVSDPNDLADQLATLCKDPEQRARLATAGLQRAQERFHSRQMHAAFERLYAEMLGSRPALPRESQLPEVQSELAAK